MEKYIHDCMLLETINQQTRRMECREAMATFHSQFAGLEEKVLWTHANVGFNQAEWNYFTKS